MEELIGYLKLFAPDYFLCLMYLLTSVLKRNSSKNEKKCWIT